MGTMRRGRSLVGYGAVGGITLLFLGLAVVLLRVPAHASVQVLTVTTTSDDFGATSPCIGSVCATLRDALTLAATMTSDAVNPIEIDLPSGVTGVNGELPVGSSTDLFTRIKGATSNPAATVVTAFSSRSFNTAAFAGLATEFQDMQINGGTIGGNGGGVFVGGAAGASATFTNCILDFNTAANGGAVWVADPSSLTIAGSTIDHNTATATGGSIAFSSSGTLDVSTSDFDTNSAGSGGTEGDGGAIWASGEASSTITLSTFANNTSTGAGTPSGGAVYNDLGTLNISRSRFVGNAAALGANVVEQETPGGLTADDNWWGTDDGPGESVVHGLGGGGGGGIPGGAPVDMVGSWLTLRNVASPTALAPGGQATLTADLFGVTGTSTTPLAPGSLNGLPPFPVPAGTIFGNPVHGSLSAAGTQFAGGVATATFTASSTLLGPASADATADSETATATMTVTAGTTTTVVSAPSPSVFGQPVTFTATVTPTVGGTTPGTPTGQVAFSVDGQATAPVALTAGQATLSRSNLAVGTHSVTATYTGDADFNPGTSAPASQVVNKADTTVAVGSSPNPSVSGSSVNFSATVTAVAPGAGTPTGTVQFKDGSTNLGAPVSLTNGVATATVTTLAPGLRTITAVYSGNANFNGATGTLTGGQQVNAAATTTGLQSAPNPSVFGQGVAVTATVTSLVTGTVTGTVQFSIDGANRGSPVTLTAGSATLSGIADLAVGNHAVTATYAGNSSYAPSTGTLGEGQDVNAAGSTTALGSSPNPVGVTLPVSFTATVTATAPGAGTPTGNVQFYADGATFGSPATLNGAAVATLPNRTSLIPGTHAVTATYLGDGSFTPSTSSPISQVVNPYPTTTTVTSTVNPSRYGQAVTFTASVTSAGGTPTGTVQFWIDGSNFDGSIPLSGGVAALDPISNLAAGTHTVTATYTGITRYATSTASLSTQVVNRSNTTTHASSSSNPSVVGQAVTFTATVAPISPGGGMVTGDVAFFLDGQPLTTVPLSSGSAASGAVNDLSVGDHTVAAVYQGTSNYNTSQGLLGGSGQVVNQGDTTISIGSSVNPSVFGQPVSFTVTVGPVDPAVGTPTGNVSVFLNGSLLQTLPLTEGSASTDPTTTAHAGNYGVTATYAGDENFNGGTSGVFFQTVNRADTTTTVVSAMTPTVYGQPVTFTATVTATAPGAGTPTGQVRFSADGVDFGTSPLVTGSAVSPPIASLGAGAHTVTATYVPATFAPGFIFTCSPFGPGPNCCGPSPFAPGPGCGTRDFNASQGSTGQVVNKAGTSTGVTVDLATPVVGQPFTFTATVTATAPGAGTPTGTVQFKIDGTDAGGPAAVTDGVATSTVTTSLPAGSHVVTAVASGDDDFNGSTGTLTGGLTVNAADSATELGSGPNPSIVGQVVTFTATVTATVPGTGTPTGTVQFAADGTNIGSPQTLDEGGVASVTTTALAVGTHAVTATFLGTSNYNTSTGTLAGGQIVVLGSSSTGVTSSPNPSVSGQGVTFTATVTSTYAGPPISGQVQFGIDGANRGSPVTLTAGSATLGGIGDLAAGTHTVTATYTGDGTYDVSAGTLEGGQSVGKADTATSLASSPNPSAAGMPVTVTATVGVTLPGAGTPTGTVQFVADGTSVLGSAPVSEGIAMLSGVTSLVPGTHAVTATYSGDAQFNGSTAPAISQVVGGYATTATVTSSVNPSRVGQPVVFTVTMTSGGGTPTGTVQFGIDGADVGEPVTLAGGVAATDPISALAPGTHSVTATYTGTTSYVTSTASLPTQTVVRSDTTTTLTPFANPSVFGQPVTFTAAVAPIAPGGGMVTGSVTFFLDGQPLSTVPLVSATATTDPLGNLSVGVHVLTAVYQGTTSYTTSSSSLFDQTVGKADVTATVGSSPNPSTFGQPVTFTATVAPVAPGAGTPTATVSFYVDGALVQGGVPILDGSATAAPVTTLAGGAHTVTATYAGSASFNPATSAPITQTVGPVGTTTTGVTATVNPSVYGQPVTFTATVAPLPPVVGSPTGQVEFFADGTSFGTGTLSDGSTISPPISSLSVGAHLVTATYAGDSSFVSSTTSAPVSQTVNQSGAIASVSSSANPSVFGQAVNFTAAITPSGSGGGTPDGSVQFIVDSVNFGGPVTLTSGSATSSSTSALGVGSHTVEVSYTPGPNYTATMGGIESGQIVGKAGASVAVASNGSSVSGDSVVFTATVGPVGPGAGTPSGTIQFQIDGSNVGDPVTLSGGVATYSSSGLGVGNHPVIANYSGDDTFLSASGSLIGGQTVASPAMADLSVTTASPPRAVVGLQAAYGVVVTNNGPNDATGVVLGENVPAGWTVAGVAASQGTCTIAEGSVSCALGNLSLGAQAAVTLVVVPNGPGSVTSAAAVSGVQGDPNSSNNVSAGTTIVRRFGYWLFGSDGGVFTFGDAQFYGSTGSMHLNKSVVAMTSTPSGQGYWLFASDGGVFAFGDAGFFGSTASMHLNAPIVAMAATPTGHGYWLFASDGGVFAFGDAGFFGSTANTHLNAPIVAMSSTPTGRGYWLVASDGGVFAFGDAGRFGDLSGHALAAPIVGMAATPSGHGYWLVASNGGVFAFGDAGDFGSLGNGHVNSPVTGMAATANGLGYWLASTDGGVFAFGDAPFLGSMGGQRLNKPMIGLTSNG